MARYGLYKSTGKTPLTGEYIIDAGGSKIKNKKQIKEDRWQLQLT